MVPSDAPSQHSCSLGISERTLSALRDAAVSRAEATRLATHIERCPACSERLAAFDDLAAQLRADRPPTPDERLWQAITTAADGASSPRQRIRRIRPIRRFAGLGGMGPMPLSWRRLNALAAVLLLTVGFGALFGLRHLTPPVVQPTQTATPTSTLTPAPTATPLPTVTPPALLPTHPLAWQPLQTPAPSATSSTTAFAGDGESAYLCAVGSDAQGNGALHIWLTSDQGADWMPARVVPTVPTINACSLVVDASDPSVAALAWQPRGGGAGDSYTGLMTTVDGGVTWQAVSSQPFTQIDQLDSRGGVIYALRETTDSTNTAVAYHLWASSDQMGSWHQVDHGLPAAVAGFWLEPGGSGILIAVSGGANAIPSQLWSSPDGGGTWHQLAVPGDLPLYVPARLASFGQSANGIVARSLQGHFHICVSNGMVAQQTPQQPGVTCSFDNGGSWHTRTMLLLTDPQGSPVAANLVDITDDGTLLAAGLGTLYRLASGSDRWQSLGSLPQLVVRYCPSPGAGMLSAAPAFVGSSIDPQNRIFIVSYTP